MKIVPVTDPSFQEYGRILTGYNVEPLLAELERVTPQRENGTEYVPCQKELMELPLAKELADRAFGGMPIEIGWCNGCNTMLNALEYHRDSELNVGTVDFILLLARRADMEGNTLNTEKVRAFLCPAGTLVEIYATTLHYAPCSTKAGACFRVVAVLPAGTNLKKPEITPKDPEDELLWARNKWLLAHADSNEARQGAKVALTGANIDISDSWKEG